MTLPRWIAVRFPPRPPGKRGTFVVAVKGTSTVKDGDLDIDLFASIKVLQLFQFIAPVLVLVDTSNIRQMLSFFRLTQEIRFAKDVWEDLQYKLEKFVMKYSDDNMVLTGHSLGGAIAQIVAGQESFNFAPALVWSAPGSYFSEMLFKLTDERAQRSVSVVIPDNDQVPLVDLPAGTVHRIQCKSKEGISMSPLQCHNLSPMRPQIGT